MNNQDNQTGKITRVEMEIAVDHVLEALPALIRGAGVNAQLLKAKYDGLVNAGFTEAQALEIVKTRPIFE